MRFLFGIVVFAASSAALAQSGLNGDICAVDEDCRGALICAQNKCTMPAPPPKPATGPVCPPDLVSRANISFSASAGISTLEQSNVVASDLYFGANLTAAYTLVPAMAVVAAVDFRYVHPDNTQLERTLSLSGGLRFQTVSRAYAVDVLVGWSQFVRYQTVSGNAFNGFADGTMLGLLGHVRMWGPVDLQLRLAENLYEGVKIREVGIGLGVRL